jgi:hypothetical protein
MIRARKLGQLAAAKPLDLLLRFQLRHRKKVGEEIEFMPPRQTRQASDRFGDKMRRLF